MAGEAEGRLREALARYRQSTRGEDPYGTRLRREARAGAALAREVAAVLGKGETEDER